MTERRPAPRQEDIERPKARGRDTLTTSAINETKGYGNIKARRLHEGLLWKCQQVEEPRPGESRAGGPPLSGPHLEAHPLLAVGGWGGGGGSGGQSRSTGGV